MANRPHARPHVERLEDRLTPTGPLSIQPTGTALLTQPIVVAQPPTFEPSLNGVAVGYGNTTLKIRLYQNRTTYQEFAPYNFAAIAFADGVHVATGDLTGDGVPDVITGLAPLRSIGPGTPVAAAPVKVFDGTNLTAMPGFPPPTVRSFDPYGTSFTGGIHVAAADLDRDGKVEVIVCKDEGGIGRVRVFSGADVANPAITTLIPVADFDGIDGDPLATAGAHIAVGDLNADGVPDVIVGAANGPRLAAFDGTSLQAGETPRKLFGDFFPFNPMTHPAGINVAVADLDADGYGELVVGSRTGAPRTAAIDGQDLIASNGATRAVWFDRLMGDTASTGGVRIAAKRLDGDARDDLVLSHGTGSKVTTILGRNVYQSTGWTLWPGQADLIPMWTGGVWVG